MTERMRGLLALLPILGVGAAWAAGFWPLIVWVLTWTAWAFLMANWPALELLQHRLREQLREPGERCTICQVELHLQAAYQRRKTGPPADGRHLA